MRKPKSYIAVEGAIGVGKTTLARLLAERLEARLILERAEENPFLEEFYKDRGRYAFQTQLSFLIQRHQQQREIAQQDIFRRVTVTDYIYEKDKIFAAVTLSPKEFDLYNKIVAVLGGAGVSPDIVVYLMAGSELLLRRIRARGRPYERRIDSGYLRALVEAYNDFFFHYAAAPVLAVDVTETDFVSDPAAFEQLFKLVMEHDSGTLYYKCSGG